MHGTITLRSAVVEDVTEMSALVAEAYAPYVARIGRKPAPMLDDYAQGSVTTRCSWPCSTHVSSVCLCCSVRGASFFW
ncbi:hypothetical protein P5705_08470 [Pseudomonas entomophila]|uniref:hypothetical protein n=1 Tax=Pseudomonas entomophila TaxID=312306 RepID=UPI002405F3DD|nr:hypothetical protein [Pseudomonas entomophila]MDF9617672.1 hypothetical protein [Pseudomonas entomophila]